MPKNIVICCDGTNNQFNGDHTNVIRTYKVARRNEHQITFYDPGVGTMPKSEESRRWAQTWSILKGLAFGSGFTENIADAYRALMRAYAPGDQVYLFGFSRGAYTARAVAAMLESVGLLHPGTENLFRYAMHYWWSDHPGAAKGPAVCAEFKRTLARRCPVRFLGLWDTVSSVGYVDQLIDGTYMRLPHTARNPNVQIVRHAVAIDERRHFFRQNLMYEVAGNQSVKNVWFAGVHADVGGGYPPGEAGLAKVAFQWMMREAEAAGLLVDPEALQREVYGTGARPDPAADRHESLQGLWQLVEWLPSRRYCAASDRSEWRIPRGRPRAIARDAAKSCVWLHQSVIDRINRRPDYRPPNLPHDEPALRALFSGRIEA